jgi:hypothetical protein
MLSLLELESFLQSIRWPQLPARQPNFFSITRFPHYENVMSNVYQFFFSTENPHGLGSLCIDALFDTIGEAKKRKGQAWERPTLQHTRVKRELATANGRLDLLIHDGPTESQWTNASTTILVENKVYHYLANNLGDYWESIGKHNSTGSRVGVVLGLKHEVIPPEWQSNWVTVTHLQWAKAVENRLGPVLYRAEPRYTTLLLELIENIKTMSNARENARDLLRFFRQFHSEVDRIIELKQQLLDLLPNEISRALPPNYSVENQSDSAKLDTWLTITSPIKQSEQQLRHPVKYLVQYGGLFRVNQADPNYEIRVITHDLEKCQRLRVAYQESLPTGAVLDEQHYAVTKTYSITNTQLADFAEHIAGSLEKEWLPLEHLWVNC